MIFVYALTALMALTAAGWIAVLAFNLTRMGRAPKLKAEAAARFPSDAPLVSVLVPARNEADRILEPALLSIAHQDYPSVEVVVVDDRSEDATFEIVEEISRREPRVRVVRGAALPPGWLGKVWALEQAKRAARGSWILATDADVIFEPQAIRAAMTAAFKTRLDALTLTPNIGGGSLATRAALPVAAWMIAIVFPIEKTNDPSSDVALGCGAFILMRRSAHDAVGGYEAIRDEVADDVATARALKRAGLRLRIETALDLLHTPMYDTLGELWRGFSKNAFAGADNKISVVVTNSLANVVATVVPTLVALFALWGWLVAGDESLRPLAISAVAAYVAMVAAFVPVYRGLGESPLLAVFSGTANLLMVLILVNSTLKNLSGRGVEWKGQRVRSPRAESKTDVGGAA